jgi:hypothetical protein
MGTPHPSAIMTVYFFVARQKMSLNVAGLFQRSSACRAEARREGGSFIFLPSSC